jgi:hypothetical protein
MLLVAAGFGVLLALGAVRASIGDFLGAVGLAFLAGVASMGILLTAMLAVGVPYNARVILGAAIAISGGGILISWSRHGRGASKPKPGGRCPRQAAPRERQLLYLFIVLFGAYAVVGLLTAVGQPNNSWDSWAIWTRKAVLLTDFNHLPVPFLTDHAYLASHQDYPLLIPLLESIWFRFSGRIDT